jgi:hypothetical protein
MTNVAHRPRAIRDQIVDREVRRLELMQRAERRRHSSVGVHVTRIGDGAPSR